MHLFASTILLLLLSFRCLGGFRLPVKKLSDNHNRNIMKCLDTLIDITDWAVHNFLVISDNMDFVGDDLLQRYSNFAWKLYSARNNNLTGFSNVILVTNNFQNLTEILNLVNIRRIDTRAKFVISIATNFASLDEIRKSSKEIPAAMWRLDKTNVVYLVPRNEDILAMTYFPFARNCQAGELEILDVWRGKDFEKGAELFPEKMLDIQGCVQNHFTVFTTGQTLSLRKEFTETGEMILGGVGGRLITIVIEKMNMKLYTVVFPHESWPLLSGQVARGESIFSLCGTIPLVGQSEFLDLDSGYMEESFGLGYKVDDFQVSWKNLIWPLSKKVWQYTGYVGLLFCGLILLANRCHRSEVTDEKLRILDCFGVFLGIAQVLPRSYFGRFLLGMWIVYSYLINATYNSGLVSFLTTPYEEIGIQTLDDLLADGIDFGGGTWHREFYHDPSDPVMMKIYDNFKIWSEIESSRLLMNRQCVTGVLSQYVFMYNGNQTGKSNQRIRMLKEKAFTFQIPISMRRGSPFVLGVRRYTSRAIQGGFNEYWRKYYTRKSISLRIAPDSPTVISIQHIRGILYLHIAGLIFSCVFFFGELTFHKYFRERRFPLFYHTTAVLSVVKHDKKRSSFGL